MNYPEEDSLFTNQLIQNYIKKSGIVHHGIISIRPIESLLYHVQAGLGVAILPDKIYSLSNVGLRSYHLEMSINVEMAVAWLDGVNSAAQSFLSFLEQKNMFIDT